VYCGKTTDWIRITFGMVNGVGRGMGVLNGGGDRRRGRGNCVEVREPIELSFGEVSVVGPGIGVLDRGRRAAKSLSKNAKSL